MTVRVKGLKKLKEDLLKVMVDRMERAYRRYARIPDVPLSEALGRTDFEERRMRRIDRDINKPLLTRFRKACRVNQKKRAANLFVRRPAKVPWGEWTPAKVPIIDNSYRLS